MKSFTAPPNPEPAPGQSRCHLWIVTPPRVFACLCRVPDLVDGIPILAEQRICSGRRLTQS